MGEVVLALFILVYFLPIVVAGFSKHPHGGGIFVVNVFLGWTLLGWVVALAWACCAPHRSAAESSR
jgi:hypothetical protein